MYKTYYVLPTPWQYMTFGFCVGCGWQLADKLFAELEALLLLALRYAQ